MREKKLLEKELYEVVRNYLAKKAGCVTESFNSKGKKIPFVNRGHGQMIVDVYGLRGVQYRRSRKVEGIAVEVKRTKGRTSRRYITQAEQYSHLAHRCYLAQPFDFTDKAKAEAARAGVGLFLIKGSKVKLVAESRLFNPDAEAFEAFLNSSLRITRCAICGCYQFLHSYKANGGNSGEGHWRRDDIAPGDSKKNKLTFLCAECERHWAPASDFFKLKRQMTKLSQRVVKIQKKLKRPKR